MMECWKMGGRLVLPNTPLFQYSNVPLFLSQPIDGEK